MSLLSCVRERSIDVIHSYHSVTGVMMISRGLARGLRRRRRPTRAGDGGWLGPLGSLLAFNTQASDDCHALFLDAMGRRDAASALSHFRGLLAAKNVGDPSHSRRMNQLVQLMCSKGMEKEASVVLSTLAPRTIVGGGRGGVEPAYAHVIESLLDCEELGAAMRHFSQAQDQGVGVDRIVCQRIIHAICRRGQQSQLHMGEERSCEESWLWDVLHFLERRGMFPDQGTCDMALQHSIHSGSLHFALELLKYMHQANSLRPSLPTCLSLQDHLHQAWDEIVAKSPKGGREVLVQVQCILEEHEEYYLEEEGRLGMYAVQQLLEGTQELDEEEGEFRPSDSYGSDFDLDVEEDEAEDGSLETNDNLSPLHTPPRQWQSGWQSCGDSELEFSFATDDGDSFLASPPVEDALFGNDLTTQLRALHPNLRFREDLSSI